MGIRLAFFVCVAPLATLFLRGPQESVPLRQVQPPSANSDRAFGGILGLVELKDGRVLVDDGGRLELVVLSADLSTSLILADTVGAAANRYPATPGQLIEYLGDSTLFFDLENHAFLVIDPSGRIVRTMAVPKTSDAGRLWGSR